MQRRVGIYLYKKTIYLQAYSKTIVGIFSLDGHVISVDESNFVAIGRGLIEAFINCKEGIEHHVEWRDGPQKDEMLEATKCKSWNTLMKNSTHITAALLESGAIKLIPYYFGGTSGPHKGYHELKDKEIISSAEPEELGRNVIKALELCE